LPVGWSPSRPEGTNGLLIAAGQLPCLRVANRLIALQGRRVGFPAEARPADREIFAQMFETSSGWGNHLIGFSAPGTLRPNE
jgi:hypothetical protein